MSVPIMMLDWVKCRLRGWMTGDREDQRRAHYFILGTDEAEFRARDGFGKTYVSLCGLSYTNRLDLCRPWAKNKCQTCRRLPKTGAARISKK